MCSLLFVISCNLRTVGKYVQNSVLRQYGGRLLVWIKKSILFSILGSSGAYLCISYAYIKPVLFSNIQIYEF